MIYLDTSVVIAEILSEDRRPPAAMWQETLFSSRLLEYEVWIRLHARGLGDACGFSARTLLGRIHFIALSQLTLVRALRPFPLPVRSLDALHLASLEYLRSFKQQVVLASYDDRMVEVAQELGIPIYPA